MLDILSYVLFAAALAVAAFSAWTDAKKSEVPLWVLWSALLFAAGAWTVRHLQWIPAPVSGTLAAVAVVWLLLSQWSLNAAYAKSLFAFSVFFWAFGKATFFLEAFILAFVLSTIVKAAYFFVRLGISPKGRRVLSKHWKDGFRRGKDGSWIAVTAVSAVAYVLTVKAVFWIAANFQLLKTGESLLWIIGFLAVFPFAMKAIEALFPKHPKSRAWASCTTAALATFADVSTGTSAVWHTLGVSLAFWLGMSAVLLATTRFMRLYLDAAHSKIVTSSELREGTVLDREFFSARFGKPEQNGGFHIPEGPIGASELDAVRARIAEVRKKNPGVPDETKALTHHPLSPYLLVAAALAAASVLR